MVGVAGKSKGCHTCRKRRVKCDETKPTCHRCTKAGYSCTGYAKQTQFINSFVEPTPIREKSRTSLIKPSEPSPPSQGLGLSAFKDDMCFAFLLDNFVWRTYATPWLEMTAEGNLGKLPHAACQMLSKMSFGRFYHQSDIQVDAAIDYSKLLKSMGAQLEGNKGGREVAGLIVPIMLLLIYTSSQGDRMGSVFHVTGLSRLLHTCGPEAFYKQPLRSAFESCRATLVTTGLISKRRSFLEETKWNTLNWPQDSSSNQQQSCLTNMLVFVPGFLEDKAKLDRCYNLYSRKDLLGRIKAKLIELFEWRWDWDQINTNAVYERKRTVQRVCTPLIDTTLHFLSMSQASEILLYNAVLAWLMELIWTLDAKNAQSLILEAAEHTEEKVSSIHDPLLRPGETIFHHEVAIEICRIFEFQLQNVKSLRVSSLYFLMPLGLAWSILEHDTKYTDWITAMLSSSKITQGYTIKENAFGFGTYDIPRYENDHLGILRELEVRTRSIRARELMQ